jgi:hypothetical protein
MKINITKTINGITYAFEVSADKEIDALSQAAVYASMPEKCSICDSPKVHLSTNKAEGFTFVKMICEDCNSRANLGQYKEGGVFWKSFEKYIPKVKEK